jgi:hypothetical protein
MIYQCGYSLHLQQTPFIGMGQKRIETWFISPKTRQIVIPAKAGIQSFQYLLDPGFSPSSED